MLEVKIIPAKETYSLRQEILRPHQDITQCQYEGDRDSTTKHYGLFATDTLIGILSLYKRDTNQVSKSEGWQLRAMGIQERFRGRGYASKLLLAAESDAKQQGTNYIWANARKAAVGFYQNYGYSIVGEEFLIQDIGPHYLIYKDIPEKTISNETS